MPFPYYNKLNAKQKRIYLKSDAISDIPVSEPAAVQPAVIRLKRSLEENKRAEVARHSSEICGMICRGLGIKGLTVKISARRPSNATRELYGLYEWTEGEASVLTVWMKTAAKGQVVAFKSFLRTVLHELCHHIDYEYFKLADSFHTEGFFKRESSLYRQIVPAELQKREPRTKKTPSRKKAPGVKKEKKAGEKKKEPNKKKEKDPGNNNERNGIKKPEQMKFF